MSTKGRRDNITYTKVMENAVIAERKAGGVSSDLFWLAKRADNQDEWEAKCDEAELWVKSDDAGQTKCHELPVCWSQARSDVRGGWRAGLDFSKIPSYHKMKAAKGAANKAKREAKAESAEPATPEAVEVVVVSAAGEAKPTMRHVKSGQDARGPRADSVRSVEDALEAGEVVDAKTNLICPPELAPLVSILNKMDEVSRNRMIKRFTKEANAAHSQAVQRAKRDHRATA